MNSHVTDKFSVPRNLAAMLLCLCASLLAGRSSAQPEGGREISASPEYAEFIRAIAASTALAETPPGNFVKFLRLGKNENGEVVVRGIALLPLNEHATADPKEGADIVVIAHVHHKMMKQRPVREDALTVRMLGIPNFVISADGGAIWEVGVVAGRDMYREVGAASSGEWRVLE